MNHLHFVQSLEPLQGGGLGKAALELHQQFIADNNNSKLISTKSLHFNRCWPDTIQYDREIYDKFYYSTKMSNESKSHLDNVGCVHGHGFYVAGNMIFGREAKNKNIPLIYHVHGMFEPWILNRSKFKKSIVHLLFENSNFKYAKLWRALTEKEAGQIRRVGITAPIVVAANGIDLKPVDRIIEPVSQSERKRALFLGRIHPKKGLDILLRAWSANNAQHKNWELIIAGPDENGYQAVLKKIIRNLGISDSVTFHEPVFGDEKFELIKSCDLFILSSYSEGFSVSILEAMACSLPVLASTACNFPELYIDGGGFSCEPDAESVSASLTAALSSDDRELVDRGRAGRDLVEKKFTWEKIGRTILGACDQYCK